MIIDKYIINGTVHKTLSENIDDDNLCNNIIKMFEANKSLQTRGSTAKGIDEKIKWESKKTLSTSNSKLLNLPSGKRLQSLIQVGFNEELEKEINTLKGQRSLHF